ncbi:TOBE domain-containing protein [Amycolatopsis sp. K13G38]|uniref:TOBE domain-containing protein n=1 Tax=Amycolatopsis acididurans TaxID=2724524 RepID=A0ABX1J8D2_9PSEU|nr:TOBE domain-containing protein [Amycolatopsis acididurans]NKQ54725.1 TOBE domain-containing protein [Amycolatopsis acididurans]
MGLSIRNQLSGTVTAITRGAAMATVKARLPGGQDVTAAITREAVDDIGLTEGSAVRVLIKSTEVSLATGPVSGISIRNQLPGRVTAVATGEAMATVKVAIDGGELTAAITRESAGDLGLAEGAEVVALVKSTEISLATG